jgi:hypothetical protein
MKNWINSLNMSSIMMQVSPSKKINNVSNSSARRCLFPVKTKVVEFIHYVKKFEWVVLDENDEILTTQSSREDCKTWMAGYSAAWTESPEFRSAGYTAGWNDSFYTRIVAKQRVRAYLVIRTGCPENLGSSRSNGSHNLYDKCLVTSSVFMKSPTESNIWCKTTRRAIIETMHKRIASGKSVLLDIHRDWRSKKISDVYALSKANTYTSPVASRSVFPINTPFVPVGWQTDDDSDDSDESGCPSLESFDPLSSENVFSGISSTL